MKNVLIRHDRHLSDGLQLQVNEMPPDSELSGQLDDFLINRLLTNAFSFSLQSTQIRAHQPLVSQILRSNRFVNHPQLNPPSSVLLQIANKNN